MIETMNKIVVPSFILKVGAQVMLSRNLYDDLSKESTLELANGSRGVVISFAAGSGGQMIPTVRFDNGVLTEVPAVEHLLEEPAGKKGVGLLARKQVPLKLAW